MEFQLIYLLVSNRFNFKFRSPGSLSCFVISLECLHQAEVRGSKQKVEYWNCSQGPRWILGPHFICSARIIWVLFLLRLVRNFVFTAILWSNQILQAFLKRTAGKICVTLFAFLSLCLSLCRVQGAHDKHVRKKTYFGLTDTYRSEVMKFGILVRFRRKLFHLNKHELGLQNARRPVRCDELRRVFPLVTFM